MRGLSQRLGTAIRRATFRTWATAALGAGLAAAAAGCERAGDAGAPAARQAAPADRTGAEAAPPTSRPKPVTPPFVSAPSPTLAVEFDPPTLDLGVVAPHVNTTGTIAVRNVGDAPLRLLKVTPTCKCTLISYTPGAVIEPQDAVMVNTELEGQGRYGRRKAALKFVFEGYQDVLTVDIRAQVALPVMASPSILNLAAGATTGHVVVESIDDRPFAVLAANRKPPVFVGFDPELDERRSSYLLRWDLTEELGRKKLPHWWVIETDHPDCPILDSRVRHPLTLDLTRTQRKWRVDDQRVLLGVLEPGGSAEFTVRVTGIGRERIHAVRSRSAEFDARLVTFARTGADGLCTVEVTPRADVRGVFQGMLEFMGKAYAHAIDVVGKVAP